jgi:hypothetical protein
VRVSRGEIGDVSQIQLQALTVKAVMFPRDANPRPQRMRLATNGPHTSSERNKYPTRLGALAQFASRVPALPHLLFPRTLLSSLAMSTRPSLLMVLSLGPLASSMSKPRVYSQIAQSGPSPLSPVSALTRLPRLTFTARRDSGLF